MGLIRSGVIMTLSTLLFMSLFLGNTFLTLNWSLEYENVANHSQNLTELFPQNSIEEIYYQNHNCSLLDCLKNESTPLVLISKTSKEFFHQKFILLTLISLGILGVMFLFLESKHSIFTIAGILIIFAALPFRKLNWAINLLPDGKITEIFLIFFTKSSNVFTIMILIGIFSLAIGIAFEFLGFGLKLNRFIDRFRKNKKPEETQLTPQTEISPSEKEIKEIVKQEIIKQKTKEQTQNKIKKIVKQQTKKSKN